MNLARCIYVYTKTIIYTVYSIGRELIPNMVTFHTILFLENTLLTEIRHVKRNGCVWFAIPCSSWIFMLLGHFSTNTVEKW